MAVELSRNNTNFPLQLFEFFKSTSWGTEYDFLKYYQNLTRIYFTHVHTGARGIIVYQTMGLGKSILAVSLAIDMMKDRQPIILLTKSLQENMRNSIRKYVNLRRVVEPDYWLGRYSDVELDTWVEKHFSFVSMNASNMLKQMSRAADAHSADEFNAVLEKKFGEVLKMPSLDGKLLIVDEAHNFFRAITNGSKNAMGLYDMIMKAKNLKIAFFTGTPIASDPFEICPALNMVAGSTILPDTYKDFGEAFVGSDGKIKNKEKFQNRIMGLVSYVSRISEPGKAFGITDKASRAEFPEEFPLVVERVNMDEDQYVAYQLARDKEKDESSGKFSNRGDTPSLVKPKGSASSSYRVKSRQLSNYCPPAGYLNEKDPYALPADKVTSAKFRKLLENIIKKHDGQLGLVYSQFVGVGGLGTFARFLELNGYTRIDVKSPASSRTSNSVIPSANAYIENIERELNVIEPNADYFDITSLYVGSDEENTIPFNVSAHSSKSRKFAIISGDITTDDRTLIQNMFNSPENKHGGILDLILVSGAGAEGLDFKHGRHVHIMEPYWTYGRIDQIDARFVRNDSHKDLPDNEKNVTPYIYLAIPPKTERLPDGKYPETTDTELFNKSILTQVGIESFNDAMKGVSIECMVNGEPYCHTCSPTNTLLFTNDIFHDIRAQNPCSAVKENTVQASEISVDGVKYYYTRNESATYDYDIFIHDEKMNIYKQMKESDPNFSKVIEQILSEPKSD